MKIGTANNVLLAVAALVALSALPALAQGGPGSMKIKGLQKSTWYMAPLEIQITDGPKVRHFSNGVRQGSNMNGIPGDSAGAGASPEVAPALPDATSVQTNARLMSPNTTAVPTLPPAGFASHAPAQSLVNHKDLPGGTSTNLMGRLMKPVHVPTVVQPAQPRHLLTSHPTGSQSRHNNWPFAQDEPAPPPAPRTVQADPSSVKRYDPYATGSGSTGSSMHTTTSVSGTLKRGSLLTGN